MRRPLSSPPSRSPSLNEATMLMTESLAPRSGGGGPPPGAAAPPPDPRRGAAAPDPRLAGVLELVVQLRDTGRRLRTEVAEVHAEAQAGVPAGERERLVEPGELHRGERLVGPGRLLEL